MSPAHRYRYGVAGRLLHLDRPLAVWPALPDTTPMAVGPGAWAGAAPGASPAGAPLSTAGDIAYDGPGWLGGVRRHIVSRTRDGVYDLDIDSVARFRIERDGSAVACLAAAPEVAPEQVEEAATGVALVVALALQGVFCLHAGAVLLAASTDRTDGAGVIGFAGDSGSGKTTLTRWLADARNTSWPLVADDVLALELVDGAPKVWPDFPQPRLSLADQPAHASPLPLDLALACVLDTHDGHEAGGGDPRADILAPAAAVHALARNSLALRLFDKRLAERHVSFCAAVAGAIDVVTLSYPRRADALPRVAAAVQRWV